MAVDLQQVSEMLEDWVKHDAEAYIKNVNVSQNQDFIDMGTLDGSKYTVCGRNELVATIELVLIPKQNCDIPDTIEEMYERAMSILEKK